MPRIFPGAQDLVISPDGAWAAALAGPSLRLFDLLATEHQPGKAGEADPQIDDISRTAESSTITTAPVAESKRPESAGRIVFLGREKLLHIYTEAPSSSTGGQITAELLGVPSLQPMGAPLRVASAQRILGVGDGGAVVAPNGPGADVICLQDGELLLQRTFVRSEVLSAIPAPEGCFLLEQRGGFELWNPTMRGALLRLVLQTRQQATQLGYLSNGRMLFTLSSGPPMHVELFRASDGRRYLEIDQPGRGLAAEAGLSHLVVLVEECGELAFLRLDISNGAIDRLPWPKTQGQLQSFALSMRPSAKEVLALTEGQSGLLRLRLAATEKAAISNQADLQNGAAHKSEKRGMRMAAREQPSDEAPPIGRMQRLRQQRPETRLLRQPPETAERTVRPEAPQRPGRPGHASTSSSSAVPPSASPFLTAASRPPKTSKLDAPREEQTTQGAPPSQPASSPHATRLQSEEDETRPRPHDPKMLRRAYAPTQAAAAWQWELARWAQRCLPGTEPALAQLPPEGGPLQTLSQRLRLSTTAQRVLGLLYACEHLLGLHPSGMRPVEIVDCLRAVSEEAVIFAEVLPTAPLRALGLISRRSDGRLRLQKEVAAVLLEVPCINLSAPVGAARELLGPGLYTHPGPYRRGMSVLLRQPILRVDGCTFTETQLHLAIKQALLRALCHDAAVALDGVPGLSYPLLMAQGMSSRTARSSSLRALLWAPRVPIILCAMPGAVSTLGLLSRSLPSGLVRYDSEMSAPLVPSATLPAQVGFCAPMLPAAAVFATATEGEATHGRLELQNPADRRAKVVLTEHTSLEAYAQAAYLAARDGAVLTLVGEMSTSRIEILARLLRELPIAATMPPPIPQALAEFLEGSGKY